MRRKFFPVFLADDVQHAAHDISSAELEDHVVIPCQARQRMIHKFKVKNSTSKAMVYSVESDLTAACGVSGLPTVEVAARSSASYELVLRPLLVNT